MSTQEKKTETLEIKHYKRSHAGASSKELVTEQVEIGSATFAFIQRMEEKRLEKECFRMLDMRGKVKDECKAHIFNGQTLWLDDVSCKLFFEGLNKNKGVFTVGTFEMITNGMHTLKGMRAKMSRDQFASGQAEDSGSEEAGSKTAKAEPFKPNRLAQTAPPPPDNFEIIPLGYFHKRREDRVQRITEISVGNSKGLWPAKTRDLSAHGLLIKATPAYLPEKGEHCEISFTSLSEKLEQDLSPLQYKVVRVEASAVENIIALALDPPQENATTRALARYIDEQLNSGRRAHKLEMTDAILTATSMLAERYYVQSTTCLPFFLTRADQDELRIQALCLNENNRQLLKHFETLPGRYDLTGLIAPERVARFYELGLQQGRDDPLIAVYSATAEAKPQVAAAFEFEQPGDWLKFIAELSEAHQFAILHHRCTRQTKALEQARAVTDIHVRIYCQHRFAHDLVDIDPVRRAVLGQHLLGDVGDEHHAVFVVLMPLIDDEALGLHMLHGLQGLADGGHAVDDVDLQFHHVAHADEFTRIHSSSSTTVVSFCT